MVAPHRILANNRNFVRDAVLTASSVAPVTQNLLEIPNAREGNARVALTGEYVGSEEAQYEIEILSASIDEQLTSAPLFSGRGSGTLENIVATGTPQTYTVELTDAGSPEQRASFVFENTKIIAREPGPDGNNITITIDQSALDFGTTIYSVLNDIPVGANGLEGQAFDWDTKALDADNAIPPEAHRITFGSDTSNIYLNYKKFDGTRWLYYFVPEIKRAIPKSTPVYFVTGERTVTVNFLGAPVDELTGIVTAFDFADAIKRLSTLVDIDGVVAADRSPTGQASRELVLRTDAHAEASYGSGGYATELEGVTVAADAPTELATITCYAVNGEQHPEANLGHELWEVRGSLSGLLLDRAVTGTPYEHPEGRWGFTIPRKLPAGSSEPKGRFTVTEISYVSRTTEEGDPPPICMVAMALGPNAVDESITLRYTRRPSGACDCSDMPAPSLSAACLGIYVAGEESMDYSTANRVRLTNLYEWAAETIRSRSAYEVYATQAPFVSQPIGFAEMERANGVPEESISKAIGTALNYIPKTLFEVVSDFERALQLLNGLPEGLSPDIRGDAEAAWDVAIEEFENDIDAAGAQSENVVAFEDLSIGDAVGIFVDNDGVRKVRKAVSGLSKYGFVIANVTAGGSPLAAINVYFFGNVPGMGTTPGATTYMSKTTPGTWTEVSADQITSAGALIGTAGPLLGSPPSSDISIPDTSNHLYAVYLALLSDRYRARMQQVLITGGISPLGKSEASILDSGDGCWRDWGDPFYWTVVGTEKGAYANAFTNHVYYASRLASDGRRYFSSKEFAFQINVACPGKLKEGDTITLQISNAARSPSYQVGDILYLPVVAAQPIALSGGKAAITTQTWLVNGSAAGPLEPFEFDPGASPNRYEGTGIGFDLVPGGVPFALGDKFSFTVVGGAWRWRKTIGGVPGSWTSAMGISEAAVAFDAGLDIAFVPGLQPSFVAGDMFLFLARQPFAVSNVRAPTIRSWRWDTDAATLVMDFGELENVSMFAVARHTLPEGATLLLEGGESPGVYTWSEELDWRSGTILKEFETQTARYLRLSLAYAEGGAIGWVWAGVPFMTKLGVDAGFRRQYKIERAARGLFEGGNFLGKAVGGSIIWSEGSLLEAELLELEATLDWVKEHGDEPLIFVPQIAVPERTLLARVIVDEVDLDDIHYYGLKPTVSAAAQPRYSATLPLTGVWQ